MKTLMILMMTVMGMLAIGCSDDSDSSVGNVEVVDVDTTKEVIEDVIVPDTVEVIVKDTIKKVDPITGDTTDVIVDDTIKVEVPKDTTIIEDDLDTIIIDTTVIDTVIIEDDLDTNTNIPDTTVIDTTIIEDGEIGSISLSDTTILEETSGLIGTLSCAGTDIEYTVEGSDNIEIIDNKLYRINPIDRDSIDESEMIEITATDINNNETSKIFEIITENVVDEPVEFYAIRVYSSYDEGSDIIDLDDMNLNTITNTISENDKIYIIAVTKEIAYVEGVAYAGKDYNKVIDEISFNSNKEDNRAVSLISNDEISNDDKLNLIIPATDDDNINYVYSENRTDIDSYDVSCYSISFDPTKALDVINASDEDVATIELKITMQNDDVLTKQFNIIEE